MIDILFLLRRFNSFVICPAKIGNLITAPLVSHQHPKKFNSVVRNSSGGRSHNTTDFIWRHVRTRRQESYQVVALFSDSYELRHENPIIPFKPLVLGELICLRRSTVLARRRWTIRFSGRLLRCASSCPAANPREELVLTALEALVGEFPFIRYGFPKTLNGD